jgi:hypothetical protein
MTFSFYSYMVGQGCSGNMAMHPVDAYLDQVEFYDIGQARGMVRYSRIDSLDHLV